MNPRVNNRTSCAICCMLAYLNRTYHLRIAQIRQAMLIRCTITLAHAIAKTAVRAAKKAKGSTFGLRRSKCFVSQKSSPWLPLHDSSRQTKRTKTKRYQVYTIHKALKRRRTARAQPGTILSSAHACLQTKLRKNTWSKSTH